MSDLSEKLAAIADRYETSQVALSDDSSSNTRLLHRLTESANDVPFLLALVREQAAKLAAVEEVAERYKGIALSGTPGTMETRTAAALAAGHIRIALEVKA